jgi:hypothetical protein
MVLSRIHLHGALHLKTMRVVIIIQTALGDAHQPFPLNLGEDVMLQDDKLYVEGNDGHECQEQVGNFGFKLEE